METRIVSRVAEILRNPNVKPANAAQKSKEIQNDSVELSSKAAKLFEDLQSQPTQLDQERLLKVESVSAKVKASQYHLSQNMVDDIAEKIIKLL
jgi:anti-sigma28 factor (negative regulator of flagellin synthesis)